MMFSRSGGTTLRCIVLIFALLVTSPGFSQQSSPGESKSKTETPKQEDQKSDALKKAPAPYPFWLFSNPSPPIVNVYTAKHASEISQCAEPKDWKEWGAFTWCRSLEWLDAERVIAIFTAVLSLSTIGLWASTRKLWEASDKQLAATERPWVKVDRITPRSDLVFEGGEGKIDLTVVVGNKGRSPGLRVWVDAKLVVSNGINLLKEQRAYAAEIRNARTTDELKPELTSWTGDTIEFPVTALLSATEMHRAKSIAEKNSFTNIMLAIIGCITYEFSFAEGNHQTGLLYALSGKDIAGALRLQSRVNSSDLAILIGFQGTGPVD
jgi:hypothetical protein